MLMTGAIPLETAQRKALERCAPLPAEQARSLGDAAGRVLAQDVFAPRDIPQAPTSIVDGYAVCSGDFAEEGPTVFAIRRPRAQGAAGVQGLGPDSGDGPLDKLEAAYVSTGALLPPRADCVRPEEEAVPREGSAVELTRCEAGRWVRLPGTDAKAGSVVLRAGRRLTAMDLSVLAAVGVTKPLVSRRPKVAVLSTGRELVDPATASGALPPAKIFDANRHMLLEMAREEGAETVDLGIADDDSETIRAALERAVASADVVLCSGGVSEGDYDFVRPTMRAMGDLLFEKVVMKPGKPASCAAVERADGVRVLVFGLPGNPASAAVTFRLLAAPVLQRLGGAEVLGQAVVPVRVRETVAADPQRPEWVRASLAWEGKELVALHTGLQRSSRAASLAGADALIELAAGERVEAGGSARALLLGPLPANSCSLGVPPACLEEAPAKRRCQAAAPSEQELQAATFRSLVAHLRENPQVQNIDLMNLSGFCRNCLSKWYMKAAVAGGVSIDYDMAREIVYGMTYDRWKEQYQTPSSDAQKAAFSAAGHGSHCHGGTCGGGGAAKMEDMSLLPSGKPDSAAAEVFEAAAFRQLVAHFQENPQVQNIDLMNLAGFCRNCLSKWYAKASGDCGSPMEYEAARHLVYGMAYDDWKRLHQGAATAEQMQAFKATTAAAPRPAPRHSDVCSGGTEQGAALEALEAEQRAGAPLATSGASAQFPQLRVGILTVSDRAAAKVYDDLSGPAAADTLRRALGTMSGFAASRLECIKHLVVPDERAQIELALRDWCAAPAHLNLILTTGGTGFAPRDVTPEATKAVCEKEAPGLAFAALQAGAQRHPLALASRLAAGIRQRTVILNLPGSPAAVAECLEPIVPLLLRAVSLCDQLPAAL